MCKGIQGLIDEGRAEGIVEGRDEILNHIQELRATGATADQILREIERKASKDRRTKKS